jgi:L-cystine uptake protein TcyP (sodium:dicarboxylate symporter family)
MQKKLKQFIVSVMVALGVLVPVISVVGVSAPVVAIGASEIVGETVDTNLFGPVNTDDQGSGIKRLLSLVVTVLLYGIGAAAVIGVVWAGILYLTARDNEAQVAKAKTRLIEVTIGLIAWAMLFTLLQWLIPGFTGDELEQAHIESSTEVLALESFQENRFDS